MFSRLLFEENRKNDEEVAMIWKWFDDDSIKLVCQQERLAFDLCKKEESALDLCNHRPLAIQALSTYVDGDVHVGKKRNKFKDETHAWVVGYL